MAGETTTQKPPAGGIKTFSCPSCGGTVGIRAVGTSITAVCQSCGSIIDVANDNYSIIAKAAVEVRKSLIPLGARGALFGAEWEVIGYSEHCDTSEMYQWREYLLFNPYQGYRFLTEADGHWNFVKMLRQTVSTTFGKQLLTFNGHNYRIFERGGAKVQYVMGEFYWRVKLGDTIKVADYVAPPFILSMEESEEDIVWSQGIYIDREEIRQAFKLESGMPTQQGIAPNQPCPYKGEKVTALVIAFVILLVAMQSFIVTHSANQGVYHRTVEAPAIYKGQLLLSDPVTIPDGDKNVQIWAHSPVSNNWVELDVSLVNDATQVSDDVILPIEYYYGYDSDGNWTEGRQSNDVMLSAVHGDSII